CEYTGAKYAVATTSCTMALQIALAWHVEHREVFGVEMPKASYVGVPAAIRNAGGEPLFRDEDWRGEYGVRVLRREDGAASTCVPFGVWDSARRFTSGMFRPGAMQCVSFHWSKILGLSQGGAILHDNDEADAWLRRARFDGRTEGLNPKHDQVQYPSW